MNEQFITQAKANGYSDDEINAYLSKQEVASPATEGQEGLLPSNNTAVESTSTADTVLEDDNFIRTAKEAGYTYDEIQSYLADRNKQNIDSNQLQNVGASSAIDSTVVLPDNLAAPSTISEDIENAKDLATAYKNIHSRYSTTGKAITGALFNSESAAEAMKDINTLNVGLVNKLREKGVNAYIDPDSNTLMMQDENGTPHEIEPGVFDEILASKFETGGAIAGAIAGAKLGAKAGAATMAFAGQMGPQVATPEEIVTVPAGTIVGGAIGAVAGGFSGAFAGSGLDYIKSSYELKDELETKVALSKMFDAGVADATMTIALGTGWKFIAKPVARGVIKTTSHAYNIFKNGNTKGAYEILLKDMNLTKDQADDIVQKWMDLSGITDDSQLPKMVNEYGREKAMNKEQLAIKVLTETRPGGEAVIMASEGSSAPITHAVNARAKDLAATAEKMAPGAPAKEIRKALQDYQIEVGQFFEKTKNLAADTIDRTDYRFDIDKLAVRPAMAEAKKHIDDPFQVERFKNVMERIDGMAETRTFSDLLELRQSVNAIKAKAKKKVAQDSLKKSISAIDREIQRVTDEYLPGEQAKVWRKQFKQAKQEYAKMKQLESNVLFKSIVNKQGVTEDQIVKRLADFAPALDETFVDVMNKLPKGLRDKTEGAVIKMMTEKYTVGLPSELQATHFPELANKLAQYEFKSASAKQYVNMVQEFAEVFKNDVHLGRTIGNIQIPKFQSYLTTDPIQRAKYEFASGMFNYIKQLVPSAKGDRLALVRTVGDMLEDPLNAKQTQQFIKKFPKAEQDEIKQLVKDLQVEWAKAGMASPKSKEMLKLYKATSQQSVGKTSGGFGPGYYYRESLLSNREMRNVLRVDVNPSELATLEDISKVLGKDVAPQEIRKLKSLQGKLKKAGFKGIRHDGRAMLFDKE